MEDETARTGWNLTVYGKIALDFYAGFRP